MALRTLYSRKRKRADDQPQGASVVSAVATPSVPTSASSSLRTALLGVFLRKTRPLSAIVLDASVATTITATPTTNGDDDDGARKRPQQQQEVQQRRQQQSSLPSPQRDPFGDAIAPQPWSHLRAAADTITPLIALLRRETLNGTPTETALMSVQTTTTTTTTIATTPPARNYELEARLGTLNRDNGHFVAGTTRKEFFRILREVERHSAWDSATGWIGDQCFYYGLPASGKSVRTISKFCDGELSVTHSYKTPVGKVELLASDRSTNDRVRTCDVRFALSIEEPASEVDLPTWVTTTRAALRQRKRFFYGDHEGSPVWSLDMTLVWPGVDKRHAEMAERTVKPEYHVEFECLQPKAYLARRTDAYMALTFLLKVCDLFPPS